MLNWAIGVIGLYDMPLKHYVNSTSPRPLGFAEFSLDQRAINIPLYLLCWYQFRLLNNIWFAATSVKIERKSEKKIEPWSHHWRS